MPTITTSTNQCSDNIRKMTIIESTNHDVPNYDPSVLDPLSDQHWFIEEWCT